MEMRSFQRMASTIGLALIVFGCNFIGSDGLEERIDLDGDGFTSIQFGGTDCDDNNSAVNPGSIETCDRVDNDCSGEIDDNAVNERTWYRDADEDGYGSPSSAEPVAACFVPIGYTDDPTDCNDFDADIHPRTVWYVDEDGDGYGDPDTPIASCIQPAGTVSNDEDCNDIDVDFNPETKWYLDADADGYGALEASQQMCEEPDGFIIRSGDCDDSDPDINPSAEEFWQDGFDNDCDGTVDSVDAALVSTFVRSDGAGNRSGSALALVADYNADDTADWLVGAPGLSSSGVSNGGVFLYSGVSNKLSKVRREFIGASTVNGAGVSVSGARDFDGDDEGDYLIGTRSGTAFVVWGGTNMSASLTLDPAFSSSEIGTKNVGFLMLTTENGADQFGIALAGLDDVFCLDPKECSGSFDSLGDLGIGAPGTDSSQELDLGGLYLVSPEPGFSFYSNLNSEKNDSAIALIYGENAGDQLGSAVADVGDVDGDGFNDLLVGAPGSDTANTNSGAVYLLTGGQNRGDLGTEIGDYFVFYGSQAGEGVGSSLAGLKTKFRDDPTSGTGYDEFLIAGAGDALDPLDGTLYLIQGFGDHDANQGGSMSLLDANLRISYTDTESNMGAAVSGAGDFDKDDHLDFLIGAPEYADNEGEKGAVYLLYGQSWEGATLDLSDASRNGPRFVGKLGDRLGAAVLGPGDTDGDGEIDFLLGATREGLGEVGGFYIIMK